MHAELGYDKETVEEGAEPEEDAGGGDGGEDAEAQAAAAAVARPPPRKEISQNAEKTFDAALIARSEQITSPALPESSSSAGPAAGSAVDVAYLLPTLHLAKAGYGEAALEFAVKVAAADAPEGAPLALKEKPLWSVLVRCSNSNLDSVSRAHLRKAVSGFG